MSTLARAAVERAVTDRAEPAHRPLSHRLGTEAAYLRGPAAWSWTCAAD